MTAVRTSIDHHGRKQESQTSVVFPVEGWALPSHGIFARYGRSRGSGTSCLSTWNNSVSALGLPRRILLNTAIAGGGNMDGVASATNVGQQGSRTMDGTPHYL